MFAWRQHSIQFINLFVSLLRQHQVRLEMVNVESQVDGLKNVVVWVFVAHTWLISEMNLRPALAYPAV